MVELLSFVPVSIRVSMGAEEAIKGFGPGGGGGEYVDAFDGGGEEGSGGEAAGLGEGLVGLGGGFAALGIGLAGLGCGEESAGEPVVDWVGLSRNGLAGARSAVDALPAAQSSSSSS